MCKTASRLLVGRGCRICKLEQALVLASESVPASLVSTCTRHTRGGTWPPDTRSHVKISHGVSVPAFSVSNGEVRGSKYTMATAGK
jgi:hypothetical protein